MSAAAKQKIEENKEEEENEKELIKQSRMEGVGWAWEEACTLVDLGYDIRTYDIGEIAEKAIKELLLEE